MTAKNKTAVQDDQPSTAEPAFTKEQLLKSNTFSQHKDTLSAILDDGEAYTIEQTEQLISIFYNRKV